MISMTCGRWIIVSDKSAPDNITGREMITCFDLGFFLEQYEAMTSCNNLQSLDRNITSDMLRRMYTTAVHRMNSALNSDGGDMTVCIGFTYCPNTDILWVHPRAQKGMLDILYRLQRRLYWEQDAAAHLLNLMSELDIDYASYTLPDDRDKIKAVEKQFLEHYGVEYNDAKRLLDRLPEQFEHCYSADIDENNLWESVILDQIQSLASLRDFYTKAIQSAISQAACYISDRLVAYHTTKAELQRMSESDDFLRHLVHIAMADELQFGSLNANMMNIIDWVWSNYTIWNARTPVDYDAILYLSEEDRRLVQSHLDVTPEKTVLPVRLRAIFPDGNSMVIECDGKGCLVSALYNEDGELLGHSPAHTELRSSWEMDYNDVVYEMRLHTLPDGGDKA